MDLKCATLETCNQLHAPLVEATITLTLVVLVAAVVAYYAYGHVKGYGM